MTFPITFGVFMPQGWKMELAGIEGAAAKWQTAVDIAVRAEELGFDSLWVYDHFHNVPRAANEAVFEFPEAKVRIGMLRECVRRSRLHRLLPVDERLPVHRDERTLRADRPNSSGNCPVIT